MATLKYVSSTSSTITFSVTGINESYDGRTLYIYQDGNSDSIDSYDLIDGRTSFDFTVYDLEPSTSYNFYVNTKAFIPGLGDMIIDSSEDITASTLPSGGSGGGSSGGDEDIEWKVSSKTYSDISNDISYTYNFDEYEILRLTLTFKNAGSATFSTSGADDSIIFLGNTTSFNYADGEPYDYIKFAKNKNGDSELSYDYIEADKKYYFYVRHFYEDSYGRITIKIIPPVGTSSNRPDKFTWKDGTKEKQSGKPFDITAEEWGNLLDNINAVREYKGYSAISSTSSTDAIAFFYYPSKGDNFLASMYNQCIYAFEDMGLLNYSSYRVLKGDPITADAINFLVETINSVE